MPLDHAMGQGRHTLAERKQDLYETPDVATEALLRVETLPHHIWEPACGRGRITNVLRTHGHTVWATDLNDYGCENSESRIDFLMEHQRRFDVECILTNPPFKLAEQFVQHALYHCPRVVMLLRLAFYESARRSHILENCGLARIHVFSNRLPMLHRDGWTGPKANSAMCFAWFCWNRDHKGPTVIDRISWENSNDGTGAVRQADRHNDQGG
jgi:hypothetical protein